MYLLQLVRDNVPIIDFSLYFFRNFVSLYPDRFDINKITLFTYQHGRSRRNHRSD